MGWTPPLDGRYGLGKEAADAGLAAARERLLADKAGLRRDARAAFAAWSLAFERREVLKAQWERVRGLAEVERQRARVGEESGLSARRFTLAEAEVALALARRRPRYARAEALARACGPTSRLTPSPHRSSLPTAAGDRGSSGVAGAAGRHARGGAGAPSRASASAASSAFPTLQLGWQQIDDRGSRRSGPIFAAGWTVPLFDRDQAARVEAERRQRGRGGSRRADARARDRGGRGRAPRLTARSAPRRREAAAPAADAIA